MCSVGCGGCGKGFLLVICNKFRHSQWLLDGQKGFVIGIGVPRYNSGSTIVVLYGIRQAAVRGREA